MIIKALNFQIRDVTFKLADPDDSTVRESLPGNSYEPAICDLMQRVFSGSAGGTFLDIGALYGFFACYVAALNDSVDVVAFEPSLRSAGIARRNAEINRFSNVKIETIALSSREFIQPFKGKTLLKEGAANFVSNEPKGTAEVPEISLTEASLSTTSLANWVKSSLVHFFRSIGGWDTTENVRCMPFDGNFDHLDKSPVVAKIDVHGAEIAVLKGMRNYLKSKVDFLFLEMHRDDMLVDGSHAETVDILVESGLELYEILDFRSDNSWKLKKLDFEDMEKLKSSKNWSIKDRTVMKMIYGVRKGDTHVTIYS